MKKAEVVTIPAGKGVPAVEIRGSSGKKTAKAGTGAARSGATREQAGVKTAEVLESASAGASGKKTAKAGTGAAGSGATREQAGVKTAERMMKTLEKPIRVARTVPIGDDWPENPTNGAGVRERSAAEGAAEAEVTKSPRKNAGSATGTSRPKKAAGTGTAHTGSGSTKRAKARKPNEKLTPASIYAKMLKFGKNYQIEEEQDFLEAARIFAEEAGLINQMRDQIAEEGLTVMKTYKTGDVPVAHPLLSELPRHVESANRCLATIGSMISERGAKKQKAARDLDAFRIHR